MIDPSLVKSKMAIVTRDGVHLGTVDRVEGSRIVFSAAEYPPGTGGDADRHEYIETELVDRIDTDAVCLSATAAEARPIEIRE